MSKSRPKAKSTSTKRGRPFKVPLSAIPEPIPVFTFDDFYNALVAADEILSGTHINYVVYGNTLDVIMGQEPAFKAPLQLCTLGTELTQYAMSALKQLTNPRYIVKGHKFHKIILPMGIIEVELMILNGDYRPVKNFDLKYFNYDLWKIPNPASELERIVKEVYE